MIRSQGISEEFSGVNNHGLIKVADDDWVGPDSTAYPVRPYCIEIPGSNTR